MKENKKNNISQKYDLAIIGAGPAGMMAAIRASECGAKVLLLEKNHIPGIKLLMTGKERCNITNAETDIENFISFFGKNGKFLKPALYNYGVKETIDFFNNNHVATKTERGNRVFPASDKAKDVHKLFLKLLNTKNITLVTKCQIKTISFNQDTINKIILADGEIKAHNYLLCTGGLSYPKTGSTGEGYAWAKQMGHTIIKPEPALTPILVHEKWIKNLEGLSLKNVRISIFQNNKKQEDRFGEALFTANGMSGPIILDMSKTIGTLLHNGQTHLFIDFKPALDYTMLDNRILRDLQKNKNMSMKNLLSGFLPKKMIPVFLDLTKIAPDKKANSITKEERKRLRSLLKQFPLTIKKLYGFNKAIVTTGGIHLKEVNPKTMRSRLITNLFFAGEILNLDGPTGGFNLQVCWSTGYLAGEHAAKNQ